MKFRFYITNLMEGCIQGTDDESVAKDYSSSEDYFVVDSETGEWLACSSGRLPIENIVES